MIRAKFNTCLSMLQFHCRIDKSCLPRDNLCNGRIECSDGSDEYNCDNRNVFPEDRCEEDEFGCANVSQCISKKSRCDGKLDCLDYSDEYDCPS